jgi:hypothetical protein
MSKNLTPKIKKLSKHAYPKDNKTKVASVGAKLSDDSDPAVAVLGTRVSSAATTLDTSITAHKDAQDAAELATITMNNENANACKAYNDATVVVMQKYPNNPDHWRSLGYEVTKDLAQDQDPPEKVMNITLSQGEYPKTCLVKFDPAKRAETYTVEITKDDPSLNPAFSLVRSPKTVFTTATFVIDILEAYLNVPIWVRVTAHNASGDSPVSNASGGIRIQ